jgi:dTDP-4-amino-4,6-dideoxygalactose transaminase
VREGCSHVFHQYTIRTQSRDSLASFLRDKGIGTGIHYPIPIHLQPYYKELGYNDSLPVAEELSDEVLSLPVHPQVTGEDINFIIDSIKEWGGTR